MMDVSVVVDEESTIKFSTMAKTDVGSKRRRSHAEDAISTDDKRANRANFLDLTTSPLSAVCQH